MPLRELERDQPTVDAGWIAVCPIGDVTPDRGLAALVHGEQVAVFVLSGDGGVYALDNHDPYSDANVLARGLVGSSGDRLTVASPIFKERFDLRTGECLDGERSVRSWPARVVDGWVQVGERPRQ
jgi:nitrite reductase (NADH) small subunit